MYAVVVGVPKLDGVTLIFNCCPIAVYHVPEISPDAVYAVVVASNDAPPMMEYNAMKKMSWVYREAAGSEVVVAKLCPAHINCTLNEVVKV